MNDQRRLFLKRSAAGVGALSLAIVLPLDSRGGPAPGASAQSPLKPNAWVEIPLQGRVRFICGRTEMGQGTSTGLALLLLEELELP
ncbi:MAG: hypothetical protein RLZZ341_1790, partial [Pseudomonadota bacterium]